MNAQQLKNSILHEAIGGRLVPQDPNDEPASVLLDKIRKEKTKLLKEGKLKKKDLEEIPISEDEIPFKIPKSWEWCKLGNISEIARGGSPRPIKEYITEDPNGLNWIKIGDTDKGGKYINSCKEKIKPEGLKKTRVVHPGDFLLTNSMSFGRPYITNIEGCIHDGWLMISPYAGVFDQSYLYYVLSSAFAHKQFSDKVAGAVVQNLNSDKVADSIVPLPPLAEQKRIVAKIEELLPKVEEYGKAQETLDKLNEELPERLKKSILQEAIEGRLVPQDPNDEPVSVLLEKIRKEKARLVKEGILKKKDLEEIPISKDEIPFEIPESWQWCRMQDVIEFVNGRAYKKEELLETGKYKVLRVGNFFTNDSWYFSDLELPDEKYCYKDDLLYAWSASFGPKIWDGDKTIFHYHIWNVKYNKKILYRDYLYYFFLIDKERIKGATTGSTMVHVSMENMKPRLIPLPPYNEQWRIVAKLEQLLKEIDKLKS